LNVYLKTIEENRRKEEKEKEEKHEKLERGRRRRESITLGVLNF